MKHWLVRILIFGLTAAMLCGCTTLFPEPTPTATATSLPTRTSTPIPSPTITPSPSPTPGLPGTLLCVTTIDHASWLQLLPQDGSPPRVLPANGHLPVFSPDGKYVAFLESADGHMFLKIIDLEGNIFKRYPIPEGKDDAPVFRIDGSSITFSRLQTYFTETGDIQQRSWDIIDQPFSRPVARMMLDDPANETYPAWSPDGQWLAYVSDVSGMPEIYLRQIVTQDLVKTTSNAVRKQDLVWAPNGGYLAYSAPDSLGTNDIFLLQLNTWLVTNLTKNPAIDQQPVFSPDSEWLAFETNRDGDWSIYGIRISDRFTRRISTTNCREPAWR